MAKIDMHWLKNFLKSESNPRWAVLVGFLIVTALGSAQNFYFYNISQRDSAASTQQQRISERIVELQRVSIDFQTYAGNFVSSVLDGKTENQVERAKLIDNIIKQDASIDVSLSILDESTLEFAKNYRKALKEMKSAIDATSDIVSMSNFWSAASNLLEARNHLLHALEVQRAKLRA